VILDKVNTHKPKEDRWLKRHKNVHLNFNPHLLVLAEPSRMLVQHARPTGTTGRHFYITPAAEASN
jgi:hypothetical protein